MEVFYIIAGILVLVGVIVGWKVLDLNLSVLAGVAALALVLPLPVYGISTALAKQDAQTFHEYWGGFETAAISHVNTCEYDGDCVHEYDCDSYQVQELETYTNSDGELKTRMVTKTKWHQCPYSTEETSYYIDTTLGDYTVASALMTGAQYRERPIPGGRVTEAPKLWSEAKARIDSGNPGPVSKVNSYKNFILASESTLFKAYSDSIDTYLEANLIPRPAAGVFDLYKANKTYFVGEGMDALPQKELANDVSYLNAAVGTELQGDLHVVFVDADAAGDPTAYTNSVRAYWQSKDMGRDALGKNAIVVVIGVGEYSAPTVEEVVSNSNPVPEVLTPTEVEPDLTPVIAEGTPVAEWAMGFTGMPLGNEALLTQIQSQVKGEVLDEDFIGRPTFKVASEEVVLSGGVLEGMLFGENQFTRVSMSADDEDDYGTGFSYLSDEWRPSEGLMVFIYILSSILMGLALFGGVVLSSRMAYDYPDPIKTLVTPTRKRY